MWGGVVEVSCIYFFVGGVGVDVGTRIYFVAEKHQRQMICDGDFWKPVGIDPLSSSGLCVNLCLSATTTIVPPFFSLFISGDGLVTKNVFPFSPLDIILISLNFPFAMQYKSHPVSFFLSPLSVHLALLQNWGLCVKKRGRGWGEKWFIRGRGC